MNFKKMSSLVLSFISVFALILFLSNDSSAVTIRGKSEATKVTILNRGDSASITYKFTSMDGEINAIDGVFSWNETLGELDGPPTNSSFASADWGVDTDGITREYAVTLDYPGNPTASITFNFKNVLKDVTATEMPIKFTFNGADETEYDFADSRWETMKVEEVIEDQALIKLDMPISVSILDKVTEMKQATTKTFIAELVNDVDFKGVTWSMEDNTSLDTKIDQDGLVSIALDEEKNNVITVKATSIADSTKSDKMLIKITDKDL